MVSPDMEFIEACTEVDSGRFRCTAIGGLRALRRTWRVLHYTAFLCSFKKASVVSGHTNWNQALVHFWAMAFEPQADWVYRSRRADRAWASRALGLGFS